jgi:diguanylate cyclase (GGDEF)-like protein
VSNIEREQYHKQKVLIVDDRPDNLELLSAILISQGYEVEKKDRGQLALEAAKTKPPDIILLDISMPEMDGFEVCQRLKADDHTKHIPIIFLSTLKEASHKTQAFNFGGNDYITKPFQIEEVIARVKNQLEINRLQTELQAQNTRLERELVARQEIENKLLKLNDKLSKLAIVDSLTQIANRHCFDDFLSKEWRRGEREKFPLSLILCDVDYFKLYNDRFGHQEGDNCLKNIAQSISKVVKRPADLVARYGGEEFAVVLPQTPGESAFQVAEKIRVQIKDLNILHPESLISDYVSLSLGVTCVVPSPIYTKKQLLVTADIALYQAKKQGRDRTILKPI